MKKRDLEAKIASLEAKLDQKDEMLRLAYKRAEAAEAKVVAARRALGFADLNPTFGSATVTSSATPHIVVWNTGGKPPTML